MNTNSVFKNTQITSLDNTHQIIAGKTTGIISPITWANVKQLMKTFINGVTQTFSGIITFTNTVLFNGGTTFTGAVVIPAATANTNPTQKYYVDNLDGANVKKTGAQTIAGVKTFSSSPIVPTATSGTQAINKAQLESYTINKAGGSFTGKIFFDENGINIPKFTGSFPTTKGDPQGEEGDIIRDGNVLALKHAGGWGSIIFKDLP